MYRVGITGSFGGWNLGDEAILESMVTQLRRSLPDVDITVYSERPEDTLHRHGVHRAVDMRTWSRDEVLAEVQRLDLFILGGGGVLFDHWIEEHLREALLAQRKGVPVAVYAIGIGPVIDPQNRAAVRDCFSKAAFVSVRDHHARQSLERLGVHGEIVVTADPALVLEPEPLPKDALKRAGLNGHRRIVGMSVREPGFAAPDIDTDQYHALLADAADYITERFEAEILFVPMEPEKLDMQHSHAVIARMNAPQSANVLKERYSPGQLISLAAHFDFAVGMRLHFLIFAALNRVPFVALPYASKVTGFIGEMGMEMPRLQHLGAGQMIAYVDRSWDRQGSLRTLIERALPGLQERARETNRMVVELLRSRSPVGSGR